MTDKKAHAERSQSERYIIGVRAAFDVIEAALLKTSGDSSPVYQTDLQETQVQGNALHCVSRITSTLDDLFKQSGVSHSDVDAIGISVPGAVSVDGDILLDSHHFQVQHLALANSVSNRYSGIKAKLENDVVTRAIAEQRYGAAKGKQHVFYALVGWGIGSAMIFSGKPYLGAKNLGGEFGHVKVSNAGECPCGSTGCVEALASRGAIAEKLSGRIRGNFEVPSKIKKALIRGELSNLTTDLLREAFESNDATIVRLLDEAAENLGRALATVINLLTPEVIILGGEFVEGIDGFRDETVKSAMSSAIPINAAAVQFESPVLGSMGEVIGAAILAAGK